MAQLDAEQIAQVFNQGVKLGPTINKDRYICPDTGAHFEHGDMCRRMQVMYKERALQYGKEAPQTQKLNPNLKSQSHVQALLKKQQMEMQPMQQSYQNQNARQASNGSKEKYQQSGNNSHYQTEGPGAGYAVTQEDEIVTGAGHKILSQPMPQNQRDSIKKTKEISQVHYAPKIGQPMIKMKASNTRNAGNDLQRQHGPNAGTFNHGTGEMANQNYIGVVGNRQTYTETDEPPSAHGNGQMAAGGSFDSRERVHEIKQRHQQQRIPASTINFKKASGTQSKIGTIQGRKPVQEETRSNGKGQVRSSIAQSGQPEAPYGDPTYSSNDDSLERKSQAGRRLLTQPERETNGFEHGRNASQDSQNAESVNQGRQLDQSRQERSGSNEVEVIKRVGPISQTKQPSYANPSKRLSQKSSARQFQAHNQMATGFSPGRKLQNLPQHVQQQLNRQAQMNGGGEQMIYRQMEDSRNHPNGGLYGQSNSQGLNQKVHYMSIGQNATGQLMNGTQGNQRQLTHSGNNRAMGGAGPQHGISNNGPMVAQHPQAQQYRGDGQQVQMSKTGMSFQKRMQNQGNSKSPGQAYKPAQTGSKRALGLLSGSQGPNGAIIGSQGGGHRRQYSTNVGGLNSSNYQAGAAQLSRSGIGPSLYEKRGRNAKGTNMFVGPGGVVGSEGVGGSTGQYPNQHIQPGPAGVHQRNKTQILSGAETANDSVFRSSIMSTDQIQKINQLNYQKNGGQNLAGNRGQLARAVNQRQSAKPMQGGRQGPAKGNNYQNAGIVQQMPGGRTVLSHNGQMLQPTAQTQMRVHSGDPRASMSHVQVGQPKYLQGDGSQGSQGQQHGAHLQGNTGDQAQTHNMRRPSGKSPGGASRGQVGGKLTQANLQTGSQTLKDQRAQKVSVGASGFEPHLVSGGDPASGSPQPAIGRQQHQGPAVNLSQVNPGKGGANTQKIAQHTRKQGLV